ncbi:MAG: spondin domain-containing protein [Bacteroidota bacterium]
MKKSLFFSLLAALVLVGCSDALTEVENEGPVAAGASSDGTYYTYEVAVRNITKGQPFTPPLVATHNAHIDMFSVGYKASNGIRQIAENGNLGPLDEALNASSNVADVVIAVAGTPPPVMPGQTVKFTINTKPGYDYISFASMLICTNDGFTGLDSQKLPQHIGEYASFGIRAYDAGTEVNTEDFADIVPPCQGLVGISSDDAGTGESNPALYEGGVIKSHPNVQGGDDLVPSVHGWSDPVGKVRVRRIK